MDISQTIFLFFTMLLVAAAAHPLAEKLRIPFSALLLLIGVLAAEVIGILDFDTGLRWYHFKDIIFNIFLPILIFESALNINSRVLRQNIVTIMMLAVPIMLLSTLIVAAVLYYGINHPGFPWIAALICGVLLSATDPVAVLAIFKRFSIGERLVVLMEGESLFNDAIAIVLFGLLVSIAVQPELDVAWHSPVISFLFVLFGGIIIGLLIGFLSMLLYRWLRNSLAFTAASLALAYLAFITAEHWLHVSGVMAVLAYGLCLGRETADQDNDSRLGLLTVWRFFAFLANAFVFMLVGLTITPQMFSNMWLAMLLGILAVLVARAIGIYATLPWLGKLSVIPSLTPKEHFVVYWGGLRGAVAVALVLSLPLELDAWYTIQSITYGVVVFSIFIQAPSLNLVLRRDQ